MKSFHLFEGKHGFLFLSVCVLSSVASALCAIQLNQCNPSTHTFGLFFMLDPAWLLVSVPLISLLVLLVSTVSVSCSSFSTFSGSTAAPRPLSSVNIFLSFSSFVAFRPGTRVPLCLLYRFYLSSCIHGFILFHSGGRFKCLQAHTCPCAGHVARSHL